MPSSLGPANRNSGRVCPIRYRAPRTRTPTPIPNLTHAIGHTLDMATSAHDYGPPDPETAPTHLVEVRHSSGNRSVIRLKPRHVEPADVEASMVRISPAMTRQHITLNAIAHHGRLSRGPCRTCGKDEWDCPTRPAAADVDLHVYEPARGWRP